MRKAIFVLFCITVLCLIPCLYADAQSILVGDVDYDGEITSNDSRIILGFAENGDDLTFEMLISADANGDGSVTEDDALATLEYAMNGSKHYVDVGDDEPADIPESGKTMCIRVGGTTTLKWFEGYSVRWQSSDTDIATVTDGTVMGNRIGECRITAICGEYTAYADLNVVAAADRDTPLLVIDVSKHQGSVDWEKIRDSGVTAVILRIGYGNMKKNPGQVDAKFKENIVNAREAGLQVGVYLYSYAETVAEAEGEAEGVIEVLKDYKGQLTYPVFFDIENSSVLKNTTRQLRTDMVNAFCSRVSDAGWYAAYYVSGSWYRDELYNKTIHYDVWIAAYGTSEYLHKWINPGAYSMWQYSEEGSCDGISGKVDISYCYVCYPEIIINSGYNGFNVKESAVNNPEALTCILSSDTYTNKEAAHEAAPPTDGGTEELSGKNGIAENTESTSDKVSVRNESPLYVTENAQTLILIDNTEREINCAYVQPNIIEACPDTKLYE